MRSHSVNAALLATALSALLLPVAAHPEEDAMFLDVLKRALPGCDRSSATVDALCRAAGSILAARAGVARVRARTEAQMALLAWYRERMAFLIGAAE